MDISTAAVSAKVSPRSPLSLASGVFGARAAQRVTADHEMPASWRTAMRRSAF